MRGSVIYAFMSALIDRIMEAHRSAWLSEFHKSHFVRRKSVTVKRLLEKGNSQSRKILKMNRIHLKCRIGHSMLFIYWLKE